MATRQVTAFQSDSGELYLKNSDALLADAVHQLRITGVSNGSEMKLADMVRQADVLVPILRDYLTKRG